MSEYQQFIAEQSKILLPHIMQGILAAGKQVDTKVCADLAILSAKVLHEKLSEEGAI